MSRELDTRKDDHHQPDLSRRQLGVGLIAVLGGTLAAARTTEAFPASAHGDFTAASRILEGYGVNVGGDDSGGFDAVNFTLVPLAATEYNQTVAVANQLGEVEPCFKTTVFEEDIVATHFHPNSDGDIIPCVRTTIEGHSAATYELLDAEDGGLDPCLKVISEMLPGGGLGAVEVTIEPDVNLIVRIGGNSWDLIGGTLVPHIT